MYNIYMVGGVNPSEKNSQSAGIMTFPIYGKIQMFQTTNQIFIYNHIYVSCAFPPKKNLLLRFSFSAQMQVLLIRKGAAEGHRPVEFRGNCHGQGRL